VEERESEVQPKDGVDIYLRSDLYLEFVKRTTRNRHLDTAVASAVNPDFI
jgi:hypothetical protein